jgi:hypothetical protein
MLMPVIIHSLNVAGRSRLTIGSIEALLSAVICAAVARLIQSRHCEVVASVGFGRAQVSPRL